jgi:hypothetical protein
MPLTTQVKKITNSKPFYVLAGAGDYAIELPKKARGYAGTAASRVNEFYEDLAVRGRKIVSKVSREAASELEDVSETAKPETAKPPIRPVTAEAPGKEPARGPKPTITPEARGTPGKAPTRGPEKPSKQ